MVRFIASLVAVLGVAAAQAHAGLVGYKLQVSGDYNLPYFTWTNTSDLGTYITEMRVTIGTLSYNFDNALYEGFKRAGQTSFTSAPAGSFTQYGPDNVGTGTSVRSDAVRFALATSYRLNRNDSFRWRSDIDKDTGDSTEDFRYVLFDLGGTSSSDNAYAWAKFSNGMTLQKYLPDYPAGTTSFVLTQSKTYTPPAATLAAAAEAVAVPLPAGVWTGAIGIAGAIAAVRRSRR